MPRELTHSQEHSVSVELQLAGAAAAAAAPAKAVGNLAAVELHPDLIVAAGTLQHRGVEVRTGTDEVKGIDPNKQRQDTGRHPDGRDMYIVFGPSPKLGPGRRKHRCTRERAAAGRRMFVPAQPKPF